MFLTYRYRIKDSRARAHLLRMAASCNQVWNYCGDISNDSVRLNRKSPGFKELSRLTSGCSVELGIHSNTVSTIVKAWCVSRYRWHKRPRWRKSLGHNRSLGWVPFSKSEPIQVRGDTIRYLGRSFKVWLSRPIPSNIRSGSFSEDASGNWYINLVCEVAEVKASKIGEVGVDLGLSQLAVLSSGEKFNNPRHLRNSAGRLAKAQKAGRKALARRIRRKVAAQRRHYLHAISSRLVRENSLIAVGDVKSASLAKTTMAKSVMDAGWYAFRSMLRYKAIKHGATYIEVNERWTTQTCSDCGSRDGSPKGVKGLRVRTWECVGCGSVHDRDVNAAINILRLGRSVALQQTENGESRGH